MLPIFIFAVFAVVLSPDVSGAHDELSQTPRSEGAASERNDGSSDDFNYFDTNAQQAKLADITRGQSGVAGLQRYLRDTDPVITSTAFDALALRKNDAVENLLEVIDDPTEPVRLQALQLLLTARGIGEAKIMKALRAALNDPDPAFVACAIQELAKRSDPQAIDALTDALREGSRETRLLIVRSAGESSEEVRAILYYAMSDSDETVRKVAAEALASPGIGRKADQ